MLLCCAVLGTCRVAFCTSSKLSWSDRVLIVLETRSGQDTGIVSELESFELLIIT